jgi:hypothetical protein
MRSARIRAIASDGPPAENGTMMVMGRDGKFCAAATPPDISNAANAIQTALRITSSLNPRHCEERSDEAIHTSVEARWIASLRSQ